MCLFLLAIFTGQEVAFIVMAGKKKPPKFISEQTLYRGDDLANRSQANSIWFVFSLSLGFDIYKSSETMSYCFEIPVESKKGLSMDIEKKNF